MSDEKDIWLGNTAPITSLTYEEMVQIFGEPIADAMIAKEKTKAAELEVTGVDVKNGTITLRGLSD